MLYMYVLSVLAFEKVVSQLINYHLWAIMAKLLREKIFMFRVENDYLHDIFSGSMLHWKRLAIEKTVKAAKVLHLKSFVIYGT